MRYDCTVPDVPQERTKGNKEVLVYARALCAFHLSGKLIGGVM
jgi:hypothetical protein